MGDKQQISSRNLGPWNVSGMRSIVMFMKTGRVAERHFLILLQDTEAMNIQLVS